jgi:hypothetical protein
MVGGGGEVGADAAVTSRGGAGVAAQPEHLRCTRKQAVVGGSHADRAPFDPPVSAVVPAAGSVGPFAVRAGQQRGGGDPGDRLVALDDQDVGRAGPW